MIITKGFGKDQTIITKGFSTHITILIPPCRISNIYRENRIVILS